MAIVLTPAFEVQGFSPEECAATPERLAGASLLMVAGDVSPSAALVGAAARLPVLRLETDAGLPRLRGKRSATLPLSFRPEELRRQVHGLLAPTAEAAGTPGFLLEYPFLSKDLVGLAQRAGATRTPVLIAGEAGSGKSRLARAIHAAGGEDRFLALSARGITSATLSAMPPGSVTLYIHDVACLDAVGQTTLLDLCRSGGFETPGGWNSYRLICSTAGSLGALAGDPNFDADLYYRLSVLPMTLLPLRQRTQDIADLAATLARDLGASIGDRPFCFTTRAIERMERYMWFGNLTEFEAVLLRSMVMAPSPTIDLEDLLFDATRVDVREPSTPPPPPALTVGAAATAAMSEPNPVSPALPMQTETVDLVIQELAHEFRNPMVTIKTLTQRLERLLEDKASREQVTRMTGEAVDKMDRALENLLQFTRFGEPVTEAISLGPLVTNCLSHLSPAFAERQVLLNYEPPEADRVEVDGAQVGYALENLLRVVLRDLRDGDTLAIHPLNGHGITLEFPARGQLVAEKLTRLADHAAEDEGTGHSIGFLFAKALVERNGGTIEVHPQTGRTVIAVALPGQGDIAAKNGNTPNPSS